MWRQTTSQQGNGQISWQTMLCVD